jgi:hypothetical protein
MNSHKNSGLNPPLKPTRWEKILDFLLKIGDPICNVEVPTGHKYDPREWRR